MQTTYAPPVEQLLSLAEPVGDADVDSGYYAARGLSLEHRDALLRMALDPELNVAPSDGLEVWGPIHAWRALCELRDYDAIVPLMDLLADDDNEWAFDDLAKLLPRMGPPVFERVLPILNDPQRGRWVQHWAAGVVADLGKNFPELRNACIGHLAGKLENYAFNSPELNGMLVSGLVELQAVECAGLIERAFAADAVDTSLRGEWIDVEYDLGLTTERPEGRGRRMLQWVHEPDTSNMAYGMTPQERASLRKQRAQADVRAKKQKQRAKQQKRRR
jgi:hypothetical protein